MSTPPILVVDDKRIEGVYSTIDYATYKKFARHTRIKPLTACAMCAQESKRLKEGGVNLKLCQACFSIAYCSKECQIAHWPSHKNECGPSVVGSILNETVHRFLSDPFLLHYLRVALLAKLIIGRHGGQPNPRECCHIVVCINFYPTFAGHEEGLVRGRIDAKGEEKIPGFPRLEIDDKPLKPFPIDISGKGGLTRQRENDSLLVRLWRKARKHANSIGHQRYPIVMVGFGYESTRRDYGIEITPEAFATALEPRPHLHLYPLPPSINPPPFPWTYDTVIFFIIFLYIKRDEDDTLKLRRDLRRSDKERLREIGEEYSGILTLDGDGWSLTGNESDSPEESHILAVVRRR